MAIYRLEVKTISRSTGQSAVAKAAYRTRSDLTDQRTGERYDYRRRAAIGPTGTYVSGKASDVRTAELWNAAEASETRKNATVAREVILALPAELDAAAHLRLVASFTREISFRHKLAAEFAIHHPSEHPEADQRNHHAHVMLTTRRVTRRRRRAGLRREEPRARRPGHRPRRDHGLARDLGGPGQRRARPERARRPRLLEVPRRPEHRPRPPGAPRAPPHRHAPQGAAGLAPGTGRRDRRGHQPLDDPRRTRPPPPAPGPPEAAQGGRERLRSMAAVSAPVRTPTAPTAAPAASQPAPRPAPSPPPRPTQPAPRAPLQPIGTAPDALLKAIPDHRERAEAVLWLAMGRLGDNAQRAWRWTHNRTSDDARVLQEWWQRLSEKVREQAIAWAKTPAPPPRGEGQAPDRSPPRPNLPGRTCPAAEVRPPSTSGGRPAAQLVRVAASPDDGAGDARPS